MMTLYGYWRSSASYRVRIALALKNIDVRHEAVNLKEAKQHSADHLARNPQALVPVLELEDGTRLTQSVAIMEYLEDIYPEPALLPSDPVLKAKVKAACQVISADIAPIQNLRVLKHIRSEHGQDDAGVKAWAAHWIYKGFVALERLGTDPGTSFYLTDRPGLFECCLIPQVYNARRWDVDMTEFPRLSAIDAACRALPAFEQAAPEAQSDATG